MSAMPEHAGATTLPSPRGRPFHARLPYPVDATPRALVERRKA